ncbi:WYL domain-containing protein [Rhodococcus sp. X156]|uniref:helix-turn-helix transcriptional regulator n=1 Tax=Rhodococcus sp. X156 TaxID=2499145 RepID=UPI000FDBB65B|nr:WYL domain-containing protein [Rhodococcus sp. X156]
MSSARSERLVNLVLCLLSTRQYLSAERIRSTVAGYSDAPSDEAFFRMFERDKSELRELGVPVETGRNSGLDPNEGYRIARRDYELPEIELAPDEAAALALAARLWDSPQMATSAHNAVLKLRAAGVEVDTDAAPGVQPRVHASDPAFGPLVAAVDAGRVVTFLHRRGPASEPTARTVEPWGVVSYRGRWYLVGHDRARQDVRCFRVSRIADAKAVGPAGAVTVPDGADLLALVAASAGPAPQAAVEATLLLAPDRAVGLRRGAEVVQQTRDGDVVRVQLPDLDVAARSIAGYGADAVVLAPPELRERVLLLLAGALA